MQISNGFSVFFLEELKACVQDKLNTLKNINLPYFQERLLDSDPSCFKDILHSICEISETYGRYEILLQLLQYMRRVDFEVYASDPKFPVDCGNGIPLDEIVLFTAMKKLEKKFSWELENDSKTAATIIAQLAQLAQLEADEKND